MLEWTCIMQCGENWLNWSGHLKSIVHCGKLTQNNIKTLCIVGQARHLLFYWSTGGDAFPFHKFKPTYHNVPKFVNWKDKCPSQMILLSIIAFIRMKFVHQECVVHFRVYSFLKYLMYNNVVWKIDGVILKQTIHLQSYHLVHSISVLHHVMWSKTASTSQSWKKVGLIKNWLLLGFDACTELTKYKFVHNLIVSG